MKIVISPAKTLEFNKPVPIQTFSECAFLKQAEKLNAILKKKSPKKLMELMDISENLSTLNYQRNQDWHLPFGRRKCAGRQFLPLAAMCMMALMPIP